VKLLSVRLLPSLKRVQIVPIAVKLAHGLGKHLMIESGPKETPGIPGG
jgi:hypothetical protein